MKKNVFSRAIAVLASTAVLGAASMMSANAAGESLSLSSATGQAGETVTLSVNVACNDNFESLDCVVNWDDTALTAAPAAAVAPASAASDAGAGYCTVVAYGSAALKDGAIATIDFTIPADAEPGTVYNVNFGSVNTFAVFGGEDLGSGVSQSGGTITVAEAPTDAPTEAPTEAPSETTAAPTTAAPTKGAPKTGTAGVAVAVAGLVTAGAAAVVLKKRH